MINFEKIDKALSQLKKGTEKKDLSDLERDGVIQRFEYTVELLWKVSKKVLDENGVHALTPKEVIQALARNGWCPKPENFLEYLKMRNETSHIYEEGKALAVYHSAQKFVVDCVELLATLKQKAK